MQRLDRVAAGSRARASIARSCASLPPPLHERTGVYPDARPTESRGWCGSIRYFTRCSDSIDPPHIALSAWRNGPMQITTDTEILESILIHAKSASRLAGCINDASDRAIVIDTIAASIDAIVRTLAGLLGNPHVIAAPVPSARPTYDDDEPTEVRSHPAPPELVPAAAGIR